jgi:PAT family beta-lactamase induction signal transducer AmpG
MRLPNPLATRRGRLAAFFLLYVTEGIPSGFSGTAIATYMRRQGLDPAAIGAFIGALYLPWALKWVMGPIVDVISSDRWGRRRLWILITQSMMAITLLIAMPIDVQRHLGLFTALIVIHNVFAATQDVAIDALAVDVLPASERGLANGLMFGGQFLGIALGGSGVLLLTPWLGFKASFLVVAGAVALVTVLVPLPMREPPGVPRLRAAGSRAAAVAAEIGAFLRDALRAFTGSRAAMAAIPLALLPMGAYALSFSLQSNIAVEIGLDDREIGTLGMIGTLLAAASCVLGGWLSDRFGRRRTLAIFIVATGVPSVLLALVMQQAGWVMPVDPLTAGRAPAPDALVRWFWILVIGYSVAQGLMYGVGTAIFMDVTTPAVAATQFTAYMAMTNIVSSYTSTWQGHAITAWGYPATLWTDAAFGMVCLTILPLMGATRRRHAASEGAAAP